MKKRTVIEGAKLVDKYGEIYEVGEGSKVVIETKVEDKKPVIFKKGVEFVKVFKGVMRKLGKELTASELSFLVMILEYVSYEDCVVRKGGHGNGEVMSLAEIAEAVGIEYTRASRIVSSLERKGVMGHHVTGSILSGYKGVRNKVYTVNPYICCKGSTVNRAVYEFYNRSGW